MIYEKVFQYISNHHLIDDGYTILLALSGGKDSVVLLDILSAFQKIKNYRVVICHFNHGVRGEMADRDEKFCRKISLQYGYSFYSEKENMDEYARKNHLSKEDAGRQLRYRFFYRVAEQFPCCKIATAHHKNDHAETILMNLFRGCGLNGLEGISRQTGMIIRPLLCLTRLEIETCIQRYQLEYIEDQTNAETAYRRNKVRLELLPLIEASYAPNIIETLDRFSTIIHDENQYLESISENAFQQCVSKNHMNIEVFSRYHIALQRRIIRLWINNLYGTVKDLTFYDVDEIIHLSEKTNSKKYFWKDFEFLRSYQYIISTKREKEELSEQSFRLGKMIFGNYHMVSKVISNRNDINMSEKGKYYFNADILKEPLIVRSRVAGDRMTVFGDHHKKVKDIFIDEKISPVHRDRIPMLVGQKVYLLGNIKRSNDYLVTEDVTNILVIEVFYEQV